MNTTRLDQFDNSDYKPGPWLARVLWVLVSGLFFQTWFPWPSALKRTLLRLFGASAAAWSSNHVSPSSTPGNSLSVTTAGSARTFGSTTSAKSPSASHCCLSQGALLLCGNHNYKKSTFDLMVGDITLEDGVWIGARASVGPGVNCGSHSVLAMGSVATQDLEAWMIHQGNPACKAKSQRNT